MYGYLVEGILPFAWPLPLPLPLPLPVPPPVPPPVPLPSPPILDPWDCELRLKAPCWVGVWILVC